MRCADRSIVGANAHIGPPRRTLDNYILQIKTSEQRIPYLFIIHQQRGFIIHYSSSLCRPGTLYSYRYYIMNHKKSSPVKGRKASNIHSFNITIHDFQQNSKLSVSQCMARIGKNSRPVLGPCAK